MRRQLGDFVAVVLDVPPRAVAHLIQWVPMALLLGAGFLAVFVRGGFLGTVLPILLAGVGLALLGWSAWLMVSRSETLGSRVKGFTYVTETTAHPASTTLLLKMLAETGIGLVTCGLGTIAYPVTHRDGQHWLDRVFRIVPVKRDSVESVPVTPPPLQQLQAAMMPAPSPVRPQTSPGTASPPPPPTPPAAPTPESHPVEQAAPAWTPPVAEGARPFPPCPKSAVPVASVTPGTGSPASASQPDGTSSVRPFAPATTVSGSNPWATSPAAPVFPPVGFTSPEREESGGLEDTRIIPGGRVVSDETVIDPNPLVPRPDPVLVLDDGQRITVDGPLVLGRNPVAPTIYAGARAVQLVDPTMRLSKTHLVVLAEVDGVRIIDIGATNGVFLESDGEKSRLIVREPHRLLPHHLIHFGGRTLRLVQ